ncbi:hypothetical protein [Citrobacter portucalensis]|uniref:hypothetical protein n=1 Tax=Citrobacter portucalensis TaxID=1639133 RepID=UPI003AA91D71
MKVYRDKSNQVINIGEWDYLKQIIIDDNGEETEKIYNPLPDGVTVSDEEVIEGWDGGLYVADDPRAVKGN